ncbi:MAG TPA: hypothetical protein VFM14_16970 [Gemmatimonadales bacterium]|nr:hypothetical protein [Gemmatimonadales bacterium]
MSRAGSMPVAMLLLAACGSGVVASGGGRPGSQEFTREVRAVPTELVKAAVAVFGRYGIPIAEADEPAGRLRTVAVDLRSIARRFDEAPLSCAQGTQRDANSRVMFDLKVRRTDDGSAMTMETKRDGKADCVVRAQFVGSLLDEIAATAGDR